MAKLVAHDPGYTHGLEQLREQIDLSDQDEIMGRPGIGDNDPHASKAEPVEGLLLALEIGKRAGFIDLVRLQEAVQLVKHFNAEQAAKLGLGQPAGAKGFRGQRLQRLALDITGGAEPLREIVGNVKNEIHRITVPRQARERCSLRPRSRTLRP